ncbi:GmrSD restriction endonuclease domain-containing protein [Reyranella humidisoli]|nr:DUF262 domain-containing protein [Reyranella sp. MMS21-HV4-11]
MIPREDFGREADEELTIELIRDFPVSNLAEDSPIRRQLRKPDFQRETNHWSPGQVVSLIASFVDQEVVPSLILWKSPNFIFVIDGAHRLSALRAWMEDDYGDGAISRAFYGEIPEEQKRIAKRTRLLVEKSIGRFSTLKSLVGSKSAENPIQARRAGALFTRPLHLQWVVGSQSVAETSFFKINSQGTPLDEVEEMLIKNRRKPIAIGARAILRAGSGHKYWSGFTDKNQSKIEEVAADLYKILFKPETQTPLRTLELPLGGAASPVDALSVLIEFLTVAGTRNQTTIKSISEYDDDESGDATIDVLKKSVDIANRITGDAPGSLGLHPAVYFYNERGKHSRFLFLGISTLIADKVRNNDSDWFKKFSAARETIEKFLMENKSLLGILLQNMGKLQRVPKMRDMFNFLVTEANAGRSLSAEALISHLGLKGRIIDVNAKQTSQSFSDDTKSMVFVRAAIESALKCPICKGLLDFSKSGSYDHIVRVRDGGIGTPENAQIAHPFCNTSVKN